MQAEELGLVETAQITQIRHLAVDDVVRFQLLHGFGVVLSSPTGEGRDIHDGILLEEIGVRVAGTVPDQVLVKRRAAIWY
jgi:hypothetical protein